jgi:hypothetical protein
MNTTITVTVAVIETMPEHLRASHRAANNWGTYPHNGAERSVVLAEDADDYITDDGEYDHVVAEYTATLDGDTVEICDAESHLAGSGKWNGSIQDCTADLGDDVYAALDCALLDAGAPRSKPWDYEGYWNAVLGASRDADDVCREFDLDPSDRRGMDEWLGVAESEAWSQCGEGDMPSEWTEHHTKALDELAQEASRRTS